MPDQAATKLERMVSRAQRQLLAASVLFLIGGIISVYMWITGGIDAILYIVLGLMMVVVGVTMSHGRNSHTAHALFVTGIVSLLMAIARAAIYGPANGLAIALFALSLVTLFRGYQYLRTEQIGYSD
jgi:Ca2+/Na+ antiporter